MLFETLLVYTDTLIDTFIGGEPIYKLISNTLLAALLTVSHEWSEKKMKAILFREKRKKAVARIYNPSSSGEAKRKIKKKKKII